MVCSLKQFGKRVRRRRNDLGIRQKELAAKINISNNHLSNIENGKAAPSFFTFLDICSALNVNPSYLIDGSIYSIESEIAEKLHKKSEENKEIISKIIDTFPDR